MLYTEDFTMRHYVGFSQIGSHIAPNFCGRKIIYKSDYLLKVNLGIKFCELVSVL